MLSTTNIVGRWDYYCGQSDMCRYVLSILNKLLTSATTKTLGQILEEIENYINEQFEESDENSHFYKDGQKDCLPFFQRIMIPLSHTIQVFDIEELIAQTQKKHKAVRFELNEILLFVSRR